MAVLSESDIAAASISLGTKTLVSASAKLSTTLVPVGTKLAGASALGGGPGVPSVLGGASTGTSEVRRASVIGALPTGTGTAGVNANAARFSP